MKKHNFYAGPSILSDYTIKNTAAAVENFAGMGLSLLEISHRSKEFVAVNDEARALIKELLDIPAGYEVVFLGGGASMQFCMVPYNLLQNKAAYLDTGVWAHKAIKEAQLFGEVEVVASSADRNYNYIPRDFKVPTDVDYFHYTTNNTIYGTVYHQLPDTGDIPLVADISSCILSEPIDVSKFGLLFAGAQKNMGPSGVTVVIVREDLIGNAMDITPTMLNYKTHADADSLFNTPPCYAIYIVKLVLEWIKNTVGGLDKMKELNEKKAKLLYDFLDSSELFKGTVVPEDRSLMNVPFVTGNADLDAKFVKEASENGFVNIKGHRTVGGMRASIYNAMPYEGVEKLVAFMKKFEAENK